MLFGVDLRCSVLPVRKKQVGLARFGIKPIGRPNQLLAIRAKHREAVELRIRGDALQPCTVGIDQKQIEIAALRTDVVR